MSVGLTYEALETNRIAHHYIKSPWVAEIRTFLNTIHGRVYIPIIRTINIIRQNDHAIMEMPQIQNYSKSQLESINAC
jgi:hypothetical protein